MYEHVAIVAALIALAVAGGLGDDLDMAPETQGVVILSMR